MSAAFLFLSIFLVASCGCGGKVAPHAPLVCIGSFGKCPGLMKFDNGYFHPANLSSPLRDFVTKGSNKCRFACIVHPDCYFAEYRRHSRRCLLHHAGTFTKFGAYLYNANFAMIYHWGCCLKRNYQCVEYKNHCPGYWIVTEEWIIEREGLLPFKVISRMRDSTACRVACTQHPICNAVNFRVLDENISMEGECSMFSHNNRLGGSDFEQRGSNYSVSKWTCCDRDDSDLKKECRSSLHLCDGFWEASEKHPPLEKQTLGFFHAGCKKACMAACEKHPDCTEVYFNSTFRRCLMKGRKPVDWRIESENVTSLAHEYQWDAYKWTCCGAQNFLIKREEIPRHSFHGACVCPQSESFLLAGDDCDSLNDSRFLSLTSQRAAFWLKDKSREVKRNGVTWTRVSNGVTYVWINQSMFQLKQCPVNKCNLYSTAIDPESCPRVVSVEEWFGNPPKKVHHFVKTPSMVSITNFVLPSYLCYSKTTCSDYVRGVQFSHQVELNWWNVGFNFMIGDDGRVYAGRGFGVTGAHTRTYNYVSYGISFIGWYEYNSPTIASLRVAKEFINCMMKKKFITATYSLHGHRDLRPSESPGAILYDLMQNWPHYNGLISQTDCPQTDYVMISLLTLLALLLTLFTSCIVAKLWLFYRHQGWCSLRLPATPSEAAISATGPRWRHIVGAEHEWSTACVIRVPNFFSIDPQDTTLKILHDAKLACPCLRQLCLLWGKCQLENSFAFANLVHRDLSKLGACPQFTILLLLPGEDTAALLFLLHFPTREKVHRVASLILSHQCVCRSPNVAFQKAIIPPANYFRTGGAQERETATGRERFDSMLMDNFNASSSLEAYQRLFLQQGQHRREVTWPQWKEEQALCQESEKPKETKLEIGVVLRQVSRESAFSVNSGISANLDEEGIQVDCECHI